MPAWDDLIGTTVNPACAYVLEATTNTSGLDHIEGQVVSILANGEVLDEQTVSSGAVSFSDYYSRIAIGLPYYADFETLKINVPLGGTNSMQGSRVKVSNITFFLQDTIGGYLGSDENDLWQAFTTDYFNQYSGQNLGENEKFTGKIRQPLGGEYSIGGHVFYRQADPLPVTIGAIMPEVDIGGLTR